MKYWNSSEADAKILKKLIVVENELGPALADSLSKRSLYAYDTEFCYIPIVMGPDFYTFYPPRTEYNSQQDKIYHSPQLDYAVFLNGSKLQQKLEYVRGIRDVHHFLKKFGFPASVMRDFDAVIENVLNEMR